MIHVVAVVQVAAGRRADFLTEFNQLVPLVLAETGCIEYGPSVDLETGIEAQEPVREDVVTVIEKWESVEHLKAHLVAPHMNEYRQKVKDMVEDVTMYVTH